MAAFGPPWLFTACVAATVSCVMLAIGLGIAPADLRLAWRIPGPILRGLFAILVAVPAMALVIVRALDLPRPVQAGILLMALSPGAPVALRRSLAATGRAPFAPGLQICVALLAGLSMPLWIAALDEVYGANVTVPPAEVMRQVLLAQLVPIGLGTGCRGVLPRLALRLEPWAARAGTVLLLVTVLLAFASLEDATLRTGIPGLAACALTTLAALAVGHVLGGPRPETRTAVAIVSAARNTGLALLVATLNAAQPRAVATILAYLVVSMLVIAPYAAWRRAEHRKPWPTSPPLRS
jgi:BASS family bile acid:Na+ symporter